MNLSPHNKFRLGNGLRVVVSPDHSSPVVAISVHYDVGFRSEPEDRSGFAHLFEHLMFGGSESVPKFEHTRIIHSTGGMLNGVTESDFTVYYDVVPSNALETALFLEADRMRAPLLTDDELRAQVDVVKEEILTTVMGRPYGRFPQRITSVLFESFANTHDGHGDFPSLEKATLEDCADFFDKFYSPSNAVLTIVGDVTNERAEGLVRRYFSDVPARDVPSGRNFDEPALASPRRVDELDPLIPLPGLALGYRMADPANVDAYLAYVVLADVLTSGENARLQQRLVHRDELAPTVTATPLYGPFFAKHPDTFCISALVAPTATPEQVMAAVDEELDLLANQPPSVEEVRNSVTRWTNSLLSQWDDPGERAKGLGLFEVLHGDAGLLARMPDRLVGITPEAVSHAAKSVSPDSRATLVFQPAGATA